LGTELFHVDGRTDMTKLILAFRSFANALNKLSLSRRCQLAITILSCNQSFFNSHVTRGLINCSKAWKLTDEVFQQGTFIMNHFQCSNYHWTTQRRISRQSLPVQFMTGQKQQENVEYFNHLGNLI